MSYSNKTYRINTKVGVDNNNIVNLNLNMLQKYDILEILSLKIGTDGLYKTHTSGYGCVVGRVLANGGVGVPNAKISIFIEANEATSADNVLYSLYPFKTSGDKNNKYIRYNLLPDEKVSECHQIIGTFPNKRLVLDDKNVLEIFDNYYKFTTVTNESGDYMIFGIPAGNQTLHMDLDLSDIGFLSQKPVDMKFKGYNDTMFENAQQFKFDTNIDNLVQVMSQTSSIYVKPFWGEENGEELGITRHDIDVNYKFEPTCIFIGSIVSDNKSDGFSKTCIPSRNMGRMDKLTSGYGTIEMIRKKNDGSVEEYPIMGNELIDENGVWCYQIPMNLDYIVTDEYGNLVPSDNPEKGLPTRTRVRFRVSLGEIENGSNNSHLAKVLVPNNPQNPDETDYVFGTNTKDYEINKETGEEEGDSSFRDLLWNNVYTVKSHIPRIQRGNYQRTEKFSGIKNVNINEGNNPIPYNNMRVNITFMFTLQCAIIKSLIFFIKVYNLLIGFSIFKRKRKSCAYIGDGLCPDLEGWYFAPMCGMRTSDDDKNDGWREAQRKNTLNEIKDKDGGNSGIVDTLSIDGENKDEGEKICLTTKMDYFMQCLEINLALENNVIQFDFYNDWINGLIYIPRWYVNIRKKGSFLFGLIRVKPKVRACTEDFTKKRRYVQQCALDYKRGDNKLYTQVSTQNGCNAYGLQKCHKAQGRKYVNILGEKGGIIHSHQISMKNKTFYAYYLKPSETIENGNKCNLFATDIVLLGNINKCNMFGIPSDFSGVVPSTFQMPPALVQTNMDSDGALYGLGNGVSICSGGNIIEDGVKPIEQSFSSYERWANGGEDNTDITEYAVAEISGIDWGISGPNQGKNDRSKLHFPGGHFLGISCGNAQVNIKSCVNLSRICEIGAMMSQRQAKFSHELDENGNVKNDSFKYIIPTGLISKDEIDDGNFRNIFATLNKNKLKTFKNDFGLREYKFVSSNPINFGGELKYKVSNEKYNEFRVDNPNMDTVENASAYTRTIEENSKDYTLFRFGINDVSEHKSKFLLGTNNVCSMPVYENSYYFYYGLKNGATAIDKFLREYYAQCPSRGEIIAPDITVEVSNCDICSSEKECNIFVNTYNIPNPIVCRLIEIGGDIKEEYDKNEYIFSVKNEGEYTVEVENSLMGILLTKKVYVERKATISEESNFYIGSSSISGIDFSIKPTTTFNKNDRNITFKREPKDNGGIVLVTIPELNKDKKPPYVFGFGIANGDYCVCYSNDGVNDTKVRNLINEKRNKKHSQINVNFEKVEKIEELYDVSETTSKYIIENGTKIFAIKAWDYMEKYDLYVCHTCYKDIIQIKELKVQYIDSINLNVSSTRMSYYLYDNDTTLTDKHINGENKILERINIGKKYVATINYNNLSSLTPYEEWAVKRALYFDESFYNGGTGSINVGVTGGAFPYDEYIDGAYEKYTEDGVELVRDVIGEYERDNYPIDINLINIPTKEWLSELKDNNNEVYQKQPYTITVIDNKGVVPYMTINDDKL